MGIYKLYMGDMRTPVGKCWAESKEEANSKAEEMFGPLAWAEEDDSVENAKRAS